VVGGALSTLPMSFLSDDRKDSARPLEETFAQPVFAVAAMAAAGALWLLARRRVAAGA